jgi:hypothetical protein
VGAHIFGLLFFSGLYIGWVSIGKVLTGADAFFWLNEEEAGSREAVVANCLGFVLLSPVGTSKPFPVCLCPGADVVSAKSTPSSTASSPFERR